MTDRFLTVAIPTFKFFTFFFLHGPPLRYSESIEGRTSYCLNNNADGPHNRIRDIIIIGVWPSIM